MAWLSAGLAVMIVIGVGVTVVAKRHTGSSTPNTPKALNLLPTEVTPPKSWQLKFDASFTGDSLDTNTWETCYPWATGVGGCTNFGNTSDQEVEWYLPSQDKVSGGVLHLTAEQTPTPGLTQKGTPKEYTCRSGMVSTYSSFKFTYGFIQITAKIAFGKGLWSALWLAAANEKWPPEVDILEHWENDPFARVYLHPTGGPREGGEAKTPNLAGWHTWTLYWTKNSLVWYYGATKIFASTVLVPQQAMYLIANLAVESTKPGACNGSLDIKSVKIWQPPAA